MSNIIVTDKEINDFVDLVSLPQSLVSKLESFVKEGGRDAALIATLGIFFNRRPDDDPNIYQYSEKITLHPITKEGIILFSKGRTTDLWLTQELKLWCGKPEYPDNSRMIYPHRVENILEP